MSILPADTNTPTGVFYSDHFINTICQGWGTVLEYLASGEHLRHIVSMAQVSKEFRVFCLLSCTSLKIHYSRLNAINVQALESAPVQTLFSTKKWSDGKNQLLAIDNQCYYYTSLTRDVLFILDTVNQKNFFLDPNSVHSLPRGYILCCYPIQNGFILVAGRYFGVWKYTGENGAPVISFLKSDLESYIDDCSVEVEGKICVIESAAYCDLKLYLQICHNYYIIDFALEDPQLVPVHLNLSKDLKSKIDLSGDYGNKAVPLNNFQKKPHFIFDLPLDYSCLNFGEHPKMLVTKVNLEQKEPIWELQSTQPVYLPNATICDAANWTLLFPRGRGSTYVQVIKDGTLWMGEEHEIPAPGVFKRESLCIYDDFLFFGGPEGGFRIFHLPTQSEYPIGLVIKNYLKQHSATLWLIKVRYDSERQSPVYDIFFQTATEIGEETVYKMERISLAISDLLEFQ